MQNIFNYKFFRNAAAGKINSLQINKAQTKACL